MPHLPGATSWWTSNPYDGCLTWACWNGLVGTRPRSETGYAENLK